MDEWDVGSSVGVTAVGVAAARALESEKPDRLIADEYAALLVEAAPTPVRMPVRAADLAADEGAFWNEMVAYMAVRSRVFDDFFAAADRAGIRQIVVLAAGLDVRAHRLDWSAGTTFYAVDQPRVLSFVSETLDGHGVEPRCDLRHVPADLRVDWVAALKDAGFDPAVPTAWLAEGLLMYLPARAEEDLFGRVDRLSAPGSRIAVEAIDGDVLDDMATHPMMATAQERFGVAMTDLVDTEPRKHAADRLRDAGWTVEVEAADAAAERLGRRLDGDSGRMFATSRLISAGR